MHNPPVAYLFLLLAIAFEVGGTLLLPASVGFTRLWPTLGVVVGYVVSTAFLSQAVKGMEVSVAYAVWAALGTVAVVALGATFLSEPITTAKVVGTLLVVAGVVVLNLGGAH